MVNFHLTRQPRNTQSTPTTLWRTWDSFAQDFDSFFEDFDRTIGGGSLTSRGDREQSFTPLADVHESDKAYELSFDMPGFKEEELNIELNGKMLTVTGKRERLNSDSKLHRSEKFYGEYRRSITLPDNVKADQISASYENGVLAIEVPKAAIADARKIQIGAGSRAGLGKGNGNDKVGGNAAEQNKAREVEKHQNLSH